MSFYRWMLKKNLKTMAPVGDLARDMRDDETFPRYAGRKELYRYLNDECKACDDCMAAFEEAWKEYARERC